MRTCPNQIPRQTLDHFSSPVIRIAAAAAPPLTAPVAGQADDDLNEREFIIFIAAYVH